ncbi:MAG: leucine-rich repeat protein [Clostridia bacterium]|nr:leucine-rich repeat protein [Clostridia bacterium]
MKKKVLLTLALAMLLSCVFVISVSALTTYTDAPQRTKYQASDDDIVEFYDGFTCPVSYVFKDTDYIDKPYNESSSFHNYFDFEYIKGKTGKTYTFDDVKGFDIPEGVKSVCIYAGRDLTTLKWISFPKTITYLENAIFQNAKGLEECVFEHTEESALTTFPAYMFYGCSNLKAFSMPDCITKMVSDSHFCKCTSMTALYLSKNLVTVESGPQTKAPFDGCEKMYFVNEPFTYDSIPEKPTIYYFPKNMKSFENDCIFRNCKNLNDVLVFGEAFTEALSEYMLQSSPRKTVVFLGDMTKIAAEYWGAQNIVLANPQDTDFNSFEYTFTSPKNFNSIYMYFCSTGKKYTINNKTSVEAVIATEESSPFHVAEKTEKVEASCGVDAGLVTYCFCGYEISKEAEAGTALSHDYDYINNENAILVSISYTSYDSDGVKIVTCANCKKDAELKAPALFTCIGSSSSEFVEGELLIGYLTNKAAIAEYEVKTGKNISYGVFAVSQTVLKDNDIFASDGTAAYGVFSYNITNYDNAAFEIKVTGFVGEEQRNVKIALGAYIIVEKDGVKSYFYLQDKTANEGEKYYFASYNDICNNR